MNTKTLKGIFSVILTVCLAVSSLVLPVFAESENENTENGNESVSTTAKFVIDCKVTGNGTVVVPNEAAAGEMVTMTISPDSGWKLSFVKSDHDAFALTDKNTFIMPNKNITINVEFVEDKPVQYQIWTSAGNGGKIYPSVVSVNEGENQIFFIIPEDGYKIKELYVDNVAVGNLGIYIFENVRSFHSIRAEFEKIPEETKTFTVRFFDWDGTALSVQTVADGACATEPKAPSRDGYVFTGWNTSFANVQKDLDISAVYEKEPETVTTIEKLYVYTSGNEASASDIYLDTLKIGTSVELKVRSYPEKELKNVSFTSSDSSVAIVSSSGKVTVVGYGSATITVSCESKTARYAVISLRDLVVENPDTCDD